jgi:protocatechuate 3,4-dioxygenase beta subunit
MIRADLTSLPGIAASENIYVRLSGLMVVCVALHGSLVSAQSTGSAQWYDSRRGTGVIRGHVATVEGMPGSGADVVLSAPVGQRRVMADEHGWFEFTDLTAGEYQVSAAMAGYLTRSYGQTLEEEEPRAITLTNGRVRSNIDIVLPRSGVLTVQVRDEFNTPVEGASVQVNHSSQIRENGRWRSVSSASTKQRMEKTDDRGEIRVFDLRPGDYYIAVAPPGVSRNTFYPGVSRFDDAAPVTVALGVEQTVGVSVVRPESAEPPSPRGVITVHVTDQSGNPQEGVEVRALSVSGEGHAPTLTRAAVTSTSSPDGDPIREFYTDGNGDARIWGLPAGQYVVVAQPLLSHIVTAKRGDRELVLPPIYYPGSPVAADAQPISIAPWSEVNLDLQLAPAPAARISGRVVRADGEPSRSTVVLRWNENGPLYSNSVSTADVRVESVDGTFVFPTVHPGDYIIETDDADLMEPEGYASVSVKVVPGEDLSDLVLTIVPRPSDR